MSDTHGAGAPTAGGPTPGGAVPGGSGPPSGGTMPAGGPMPGGLLPAGASGTLLIGDRRFEWRHGAVVTIGRDTSCDVVVEHPKVSRTHVRIEAAEGRRWVLRDAGSSNGTFVDGNRVNEVVIASTTPIVLGPDNDSPTLVVAVMKPQVAEQSLGRLSNVYQPTREVVTIGRDHANDLVIVDDPRASRRHAEMRLRGDGKWEIRDVGSHNGTFVNGVRVEHSDLRDADIVAMGNHVFRFYAGSLEEFSTADDTSLDVLGLQVSAGSTALLHNISFSVPSRSVLAVVGPSGAGKTTLLRSLMGFTPARSGRVQFAGRDMFQAYEEMRGRIGYVPQDDLVHPQLTTRRELEYAAALRLPADLAKDESRSRVQVVMDELGISERANLMIEKLSGGQRKRVSVAIELLTQPALLFLDEPTSGLDPGNEHQVMSVLRRLADGGRIVVCVTHATQSLGLVDRVLFLTRGGHVAYFGPPDSALAYFDRHGVKGGYTAIFKALEEPGTIDWATLFSADPDYERYVARSVRHMEAGHDGSRPQTAPSRGVARWHQLSVLIRRQIRIIGGDRRTLLLLALQAPLFGAIIALLFPPQTLSTLGGPLAALLLWLLVISATWLGASNTVREIVKELAVYRRERAVGLSSSAYVASKAVVFGVITIVQSVIVVFIGLARQSLPPNDKYGIIPHLYNNDLLSQARIPGIGHSPLLNGVQPFGVSSSNLLLGLKPFDMGSLLNSQLLELLIAVSLSGLAGMALGLAISARVRRSDQALVVLPIALIVQMTLSLPILQLLTPNPILRVLGYLTSGSWGMSAVASTTSLNQLVTSYLYANDLGAYLIRYGIGHPFGSDYPRQKYVEAIVGLSTWRHAVGPWLLAIGVLVGMTVLFLVVSWHGIRRYDVGRRSAAGPIGD